MGIQYQPPGAASSCDIYEFPQTKRSDRTKKETPGAALPPHTKAPDILEPEKMPASPNERMAGPPTPLIVEHARACILPTQEEVQNLPPINAPAVQRITFGRILTTTSHGCEDHDGPGFVLGLGKKPSRSSGVRGHLSAVKPAGNATNDGDDVYTQLMDAVPELTKHKLDADSGPYADRDDEVAAFSSHIFSGWQEGDMYGAIRRAMDACRPFVGGEAEVQFPREFSSNYTFIFDQTYLPPDELVTAGDLLSGSRIYENQAIGGHSILLAHAMEPFILAVAALRSKGIPAYPALAVMPGQELGSENYFPLIAIVDLAREVPLTSFTLMPMHPAMGSIELISDEAMAGMTQVMLAETRVRHLTAEMVRQFQEAHTMLSNEEIENQLLRIAAPLYECHKAWPGSRFISDSLTFVSQQIFQAAEFIQGQELYLAMETNAAALLSKAPQLAQPGAIEALAQSMAQDISRDYKQVVLNELSRLITEAM